MNTPFTKIQIDQHNMINYTTKLKYFCTKALIYGVILAVLFKRPKFFIASSLGMATGYCHYDLETIFKTAKKREV